jgi:toxin ParE1/3/4
MALPIHKTPLAQLDLLDIASFIAEDNLDAAERFLDAADETFAWLASMPLIGRACAFRNPLAQGVRLWRVRRFERYLIFYRPIATGGIEVVRVLHSSRDIESLFED